MPGNYLLCCYFYSMYVILEKENFFKRSYFFVYISVFLNETIRLRSTYYYFFIITRLKQQ